MLSLHKPLPSWLGQRLVAYFIFALTKMINERILIFRDLNVDGNQLFTPPFCCFAVFHANHTGLLCQEPRNLVNDPAGISRCPLKSQPERPKGKDVPVKIHWKHLESELAKYSCRVRSTEVEAPIASTTWLW